VFPKIIHHGARDGVTGSCHELQISLEDALLIDCGLFQGAEVSPGGAGADQLAIEFPTDHIRALVVTHVHIDHVGRIPYLIAAGFKGPIYCSEPSALLLPMVLEDAMRVGVTRNQDLIDRYIKFIRKQLRPLPYGQWQQLAVEGDTPVSIRLQRAGHILGSAWVECLTGEGDGATSVIFSGDLGAKDTPLLVDPDQPKGCDILVLESTYGDRLHDDRLGRIKTLKSAVEHALKDAGTVLIPAFSIGRTQELLYELEEIIHQASQREQQPNSPDWKELNIILDSPLAARFTDVYRQLKPYWDAEAREKLSQGRHPLAFEQLTTVDSHKEHQQIVNYLAHSKKPAIVLAAGGMCAGGRIVNYLKAMLGEPKHDVLFVGYQAKGTPGRDIQEYGPRGGYVFLDGEKIVIRAQVHTLSGYSAHADQQGLVGFVEGMVSRPREVRLVHGDQEAKSVLASLLASRGSLVLTGTGLKPGDN